MRLVQAQRKRPTKRERFVNFVTRFFLFSSILFLASCLFLKTYNNKLSAQTQQLQREIAAVEIQNDALTLELQELVSAQRVEKIASSNGMTRIQENIVTISNGESTASGD